MSVAVLVASRGRPAAFSALLDAIESTARGDVKVYCGLDEDDPTRLDYPARPFFGTYVVGPRNNLAGWTNHLAGLALADHHTVLASFGDDHRPRTPGWDQRVCEAFCRMGDGLVYTRDGLQDERLPTAPFWSAGVIRVLGWFFPPVLAHMFADNYWLRLAQDIGRCSFLPDVLVEHMHPSAGKAVADELNDRNDSFMEADRAAFHEFVATEHPLIVARVTGLLGMVA